MEKQVADSIARMDGVGLVETGGRTYSMRIWLDQTRLAGLNVSIAEIKSAIESQNVQAAAGTVGGEYASRHLTFKLNVKGRLTSKEEFENIIIRNNPETGGQIRIKDVARVELGCKGYTTRGKFNENTAVSLSVYKSPEANAVETAKRVKEEVDKWIKRMPKGVVGVLADDSTAFTEVFLKETYVTLFVALLLVVAITAPVIWVIDFAAASLAESPSRSIRDWVFSTTTIASSTSEPITRISPNIVRTLSVKPNR